MSKKIPVLLTLYCFCSHMFAQQIQPIWQLREPTDGGTQPHAFTPTLLLDSFQNIITLGEIYAPGPAVGFTTIKYNPDGQKLWERSVQTSALDFMTAAVTDRYGAVYVAGQTLANPITGSTANQVLIKYAPNGDTLQLGYFQVDSSVVRGGISQLMIDADQNLIIFGGFSNPVSGWAGMFVQKRTPDGTVIWTAVHVDSTSQFGVEKAVWAGDRWVCWGRNASTANGGTRLLCWQVDLNGHTISAHSSILNPEIVYTEYIDQKGNAYMTKGSEHKLTMYDTAAMQKWTFQMPSTQTPQGNILAVTNDGENNIYVTGYVLESNHKFKTLTTKLDINGNQIWQNILNDQRSIFDRFNWINKSLLLATGVYNIDFDSSFYECGFALFNKNGVSRFWNSDLDGRRNHIYESVFDSSNIYVTGISDQEDLQPDIRRQFLAKYPLNVFVKTGEPTHLVGNMSVWPNPFVDHADLHIVRNGPPEKGRLTVRDMSGRLVSVQELLVGSSDQTIALKDLENAPSGVYSVTLAVGNEWYEARAVKMR